MSWKSNVLVPVNDPGAIDASDVSPPEDQLDVGPKAQLDAARAAAKSLIGSGTIQGDPIDVTLQGHSGGGSPDEVTLVVRSAQTAPSPGDAVPGEAAKEVADTSETAGQGQAEQGPTA